MKQRGHSPNKLGAHKTTAGWSATVWAPDAQRVDLLVLNASGHEKKRIACAQMDAGRWTCEVNSRAKVLRYAWSVDDAGPFIDPYARRYEGGLVHADQDDQTTAAHPISCADSVSIGQTAWNRPGHAAKDLVVYECHAKGISQLDRRSRIADRGKLKAWHDGRLAGELAALGVTAIEFLPLQAFADERHLPPLGLSNYWGYNTYGFFAPDPRYGSADDVIKMVQACHQAGIEVLLDVVYNHSAEGDHLGPAFAFKGLANERYYRIDPHNSQRYQNPTGTGNSLDTSEPEFQTLVLDSLAYWHNTLGIDGFRFDLAPTLARDSAGEMGACDLLDQIAADPRLVDAKLIAEPWDIGYAGYQLDGDIFSARWHQWSDRYRDATRKLIAEPVGALRAFAEHLVGPSDHVSFITAHDGFSLRDLVSYEQRHNQANGEGNRDGHGHNLSVNFGVEGETDDAAITERRTDAARFLLAVLSLSRPTPMLSMGDEVGRTQRGNNNAYCQDNEISWLAAQVDPDWDLRADLTAALTARRDHLNEFLTKAITPENTRWFDYAGVEMTATAWESHELMVLTMVFDGRLALTISLDGQAARLPGEDWVVQYHSAESGPYVRLATRSL